MNRRNFIKLGALVPATLLPLRVEGSTKPIIDMIPLYYPNGGSKMVNVKYIADIWSAKELTHTICMVGEYDHHSDWVVYENFFTNESIYSIVNRMGLPLSSITKKVGIGGNLITKYSRVQ